MLQTIVVRGLLLLAAGTAIVLSFSCNVYFWASVMAHDPVAQRMFVALSVAAGLLKTGLASYPALCGRPLSSDRALTSLFLVAFAWDILSGAGFAAMTRSEATASRAAENAPRQEMLQKLDVAKAALGRLAHVPLTGRIQAELASAETAAPDCTVRRYASGNACKGVARLRADLVEAEARDRAQADVLELAARLARLEPTVEADPQAMLIVGHLKTFGVNATPEAVQRMLGLFVVLLIELGSTIGFRAAISPMTAKPGAPTAPVPDSPVPTAPQVVRPPKPRKSTGPSASVDFAELLRRALASRAVIPGSALGPDGWLHVSQRDLAASAGVSAPTISRRLKALESGGEFEIAPSPKGTAIRAVPRRLVAVK